MSTGDHPSSNIYVSGNAKKMEGTRRTVDFKVGGTTSVYIQPLRADARGVQDFFFNHIGLNFFSKALLAGLTN